MALILAVTWVAVPAAAAGARVIRVPVDSRLFLPCANGGAGEVVHFTGTILGVSSGTTDGSGASHAISIEVEQGVSGVGETTGKRYVEHFVNLFFNTTGSGGFPLVSTQQLIYRVYSAGSTTDGRGNPSPVPGTDRNHGSIRSSSTLRRASAADFCASVIFGSCRIISIFPSINRRAVRLSSTVCGVLRSNLARRSAMGASEDRAALLGPGGGGIFGGRER